MLSGRGGLAGRRSVPPPGRYAPAGHSCGSRNPGCGVELVPVQAVFPGQSPGQALRGSQAVDPYSRPVATPLLVIPAEAGIQGVALRWCQSKPYSLGKARGRPFEARGRSIHAPARSLRPCWSCLRKQESRVWRCAGASPSRIPWAKPGAGPARLAGGRSVPLPGRYAPAGHACGSRNPGCGVALVLVQAVFPGQSPGQAL